ncbi:MAG: tetratricopeptide repeat protein [Anaerolineae bacterium]|nr:tetratricopeptide repeat protein [Anaerolineae bacterium]
MARIDQHLGFTRYEADTYYKQALEAFRKGDFDAAIDNMKNAIAALPKKPEYYAARGLMYLEDGVTQSALDDFDHALRLFPHEMLAHYGRGIIAFKDRNWDDALQHFTAAYYADTQRPETLYYLALTYYHQRDFASAANLMKLANDRFEATNDRRKADAQKWLRELAKLADKTAELLKAGDDRALEAGSERASDAEA